ncbi:hypothetical protein BCR42DRAFT_421078 [Absidia repens]|uniref:Uncharacterized protein n=1 Tax=Absidia repens TaxID=90262 RepID=A0A1X2IAN6_9FUNG|nr:hypothetical protein BCR42DRAFT_421078 [Absidia repens]
MRRFFQSSRMDCHDILSYHFKEQCKLLRKINTTMPNARSLHDQPSVRVKANGAIVLHPSYHTSSISLDWTPAIVSNNYDDNDDDDQEEGDKDNNNDDDASIATLVFLTAAPLRRPSSSH